MPISPSVGRRAAGSAMPWMIWPKNRCSMDLSFAAFELKRRREQEARDAAQARARVGRGADVIDVRNVSPVIDARLERSPQEELVERARAAVRIAANQIDVYFLEV